ncbi:hypothetical protein LJ656_09600 [Paraburkholderia sp. MMS20-SJTR3]|uniref:Uncharacterized protein n=1 Tax=Paraburkholderia sejongensis TaxID=2886946 RepID=A0ABS8JSJ5_9BURK|nr:hypothetical protein [Paraburkholderia sp. MMS20-SJTR3]MCC8392842.1 hypothetical protein [Paraburkholderia sp. MMS20-SJTR3]
MKRYFYISLVSLGSCFSLVACGDRPPAIATQSAHVKTQSIAKESELLRITLTPDAEERLGIAHGPVTIRNTTASRMFQAEVVVPPLATGGLPISTTNDLSLLASNQVRADGEMAKAQAELTVAKKAADRAAALVQHEAGSVRAHDEAMSALAVARANLEVAQRQRSLLGPSVSSMVQHHSRWVRVPVFAANLSALDLRAPASLRGLGAGDRAYEVRRVNGPPSANQVAGTVDLYYSLEEHLETFKLGQRVAVDIPIKGATKQAAVPASAIVRDIHGGEWVYVRTQPHTYERRRVEVAKTEDGSALLARAAMADADVVHAGAAELFGTEFGTK